MRHFIGLDDGNLLLDISFEKRPDLGMPIIHHLLSTVRKSKVTIFACTQTPHQIGAGIHSNSFMKNMFSLSDGKDIECMQHSMGIIDPEQKAYCYKLQPREMIIKFSSRYQEPFLAKVPEFHLPSTHITEEEIKLNNMRILASFPKIIERYKPETEVKEEKKPETQPVKNEEKAFLMDIYNRPYVSITERYRTTNLSASKGDRVVKNLIRKNLVRIHTVNLGGRGGLTKLLELTEEGYKTTGMIPRKDHTRGGGFEHCFWVETSAEEIKEKFKDCRVYTEQQLKGKFIDVLVVKGSFLIALEIAMTSTNEEANIQKDLQAGCSFVIVGCRDKKVLEELKQIHEKLQPEAQNRVKLCLLSSLVSKEFPDVLEICNLPKTKELL